MVKRREVLEERHLETETNASNVASFRYASFQTNTSFRLWQEIRDGPAMTNENPLKWFPQHTQTVAYGRIKIWVPQQSGGLYVCMYVSM